MKNDSYAAKVKSSLISLQSKLYGSCWYHKTNHRYKSLIQILDTNHQLTSFKGILVYKLSTSVLAMKWSGQKLETSSAGEKETCTEDLLTVRGRKIGTKNERNYFRY